MAILQSGSEPDASAPRTALLVSRDASCSNRVREFLTVGSGAVALERVPTLNEARARLDAFAFDVMLTDPAGFAEVCAAWPDAPRRADLLPPIIVLADRDDPEQALAVLRDGAQDYLDIHGESPRRIVRCVRHAIERHRLIAELREAKERAQFAATHDPLTQLPNRPMFEEQMQRALPRAL